MGTQASIVPSGGNNGKDRCQHYCGSFSTRHFNTRTVLHLNFGGWARSNYIRFKEFVTAREALLKGDIYTAQDAAGRMPTEPKGFVSSFEYAGELELEFDAKGGVLAPDDGSATEGYVRHLHLNNATGKQLALAFRLGRRSVY